MSIILLVLFLLSCTCTTSVSSIAIDKDDEIALLKIKKQLGDPDALSSWVEGFDFCFANVSNNRAISCGYDGRVISLILTDLNITAPFPDAICGLTEVGYLVLYNIPGLYGPIPCCITKLSNLYSLFIEKTSLCGPVPGFYNNTILYTINLSDNHLSGTIPSSLSTLPKLDILQLSSNHLTGTIPPGLLQYSSFPYLDLSSNNLTGELPTSYGSVDFWTINLSDNRLSGDASFLFGRESWFIFLGNNELEFDLSHVEFKGLLFEFDISHNKIYGKVPDSLATAFELGAANLSFNRLCGELPKGDNMSKFNATDFANNACLCGYPLPSCYNWAPAAAPSLAPFDSAP